MIIPYNVLRHELGAGNDSLGLPGRLRSSSTRNMQMVTTCNSKMNKCALLLTQPAVVIDLKAAFTGSTKVHFDTYRQCPAYTDPNPKLCRTNGGMACC